MQVEKDREIEVKFYLRDLAGVSQRLRDLGAELAAPRVFEANLRFDTRGRELTKARQVLRLRQDQRARMTFKGPAEAGSEVISREEIEFEVSDFSAAQRLLEALGYEVSAMYEKFRATYHLGGLEVVLDELPYGSFIEIEGPDGEAIQAAALQLGLRWEARCTDSYLGLFERLRAQKWFEGKDLSFRSFKGINIVPEDLGLDYAD
jgi:adenylate cyclase, class 2